MRTNLIICLIIALSLVLCPVTALGEHGSGKETPKQTVSEATQAKTVKAEKYISVMSASTGNTEKVKLREYVIGSVAAEMSPLCHTQALMAQAVASYTYAIKIKEQNEKRENKAYGGADITDSPDIHQGYINEKQRKEKWKDNFEAYEKKIENAVDSVLGSYITYNGETALAVYHSVSAGKTQSAETLWGEKIPYLISVESPGDKLAPDYISTKKLDADEFSALAKKCGVKLKGESKDWVGELTKDESGYVISVRLGSQEVSAAKFREEFELRSLSFDIEKDAESFVITCRGYGHGAGMSQYGADYMARQGSSWREILKHYYPGTEISTVAE